MPKHGLAFRRSLVLVIAMWVARTMQGPYFHSH